MVIKRGTTNQFPGAGGECKTIITMIAAVNVFFFALRSFSTLFLTLIYIFFRLGVMLGVYVSGISGGHLNPAVTLANCVYRKFPWQKFPVYMLAQVLGAFCGAGVVYANYKSAIDVFEGGAHIRTVGLPTSSAGIFCTYPAPFMTKTGQFFSEFIASSILMFVIYALNDEGNLGAGDFTPLALFFVIFGIGACFGWETGYAINLARDFGPRLMSYFLGYGHEVWSAGGYYFWVSVFFCFFYSVRSGSTVHLSTKAGDITFFFPLSF